MQFFTHKPSRRRDAGSTRHAPVLRIALASLLGLLTVGAAQAQELTWDRLGRGLAVTVWDPGSGCAGVVPALLLVRIDPERFQFSTYHFRDEGVAAPLTIQEWQQRTKATIVFNAGLFREDYSYLGLLLKEGRSLGSGVHPRWKGLFVAEPARVGLRKARVLDLASESFQIEAPPYREVAQSLMLVDASGRPRVRHTGKRARQTVVAEDRAGNIILIKTAAEAPLWELAVCLRDGVLNLHHAMVMDGGSSSDLAFAAALLRPRDSGTRAPTWQHMVDGAGTAHIPLPAVIGLTPRPHSPPN